MENYIEHLVKKRNERIHGKGSGNSSPLSFHVYSFFIVSSHYILCFFTSYIVLYTDKKR